MERAHRSLPVGSWPHHKRGGTVALDFDRRSRRRLALRTEEGRDFLLDLAEAPRLRHGDGLLLESGEIVEVFAAPERLLELRCADAASLVRLAWHLGNRHIPTQLLGEALRIREDHVLAEMARGLGAQVVALKAAFDPEGGAYAGGHGHHHHHDHGDEDHRHPHRSAHR